MPTINQLNAANAINSGDLMALYVSDQGDVRKVSMSLILDFMQNNLTFSSTSKIVQYAVPATGGTVVVTDTGHSVWLILSPAGTLATLSITLPDALTAEDMTEVEIISTNTVTALTLNLNNAVSIIGTIAAITANTPYTFRFDATTKSWYRTN